MIKSAFRPCVLGVLLMAAVPGYGQKATEIFIPIGKSPGLSGEVTTTGRISSVDRRERRLTMTDPDSGGIYDVQLSDSTRIWLDRSSLKLPNQQGSFADIESGMLAEIKYLDNQRDAPAEWIKLRIDEAQ